MKKTRHLILCLSMALMFLASSRSVSGQQFKTVHTFEGQGSNDGQESLGVAVDAKGNIFGTAAAGGASGRGTIYKLGHNGKYVTLHDFAGGTMDGSFPNGGVILDQRGNLFGTTIAGGDGPCGGGCGTVFRLNQKGKFSLLHTFQNDAQGGVPSGSVAMDAQGNIFGETQVGGNVTGKCFSLGGCGTIFRIDAKTKKLSTIHKFRWSEGALPFAGLAFDSKGNLYGIAEEGGANLCKSGFGPAPGCGTLFKVDPMGTFTVLHVFKQTDGQFPVYLTIDQNDNLYGTTLKGGDSSLGEVFRLDHKGKFSVIHSFTGTDGEFPGGVVASQGKLFGAVGAGGDFSVCTGTPAGCGVIFEMDPDGANFQLLHTFEDSTDGATPYIFLAVDSAGKLYGTTTAGGDNQVCGGVGCGTLYRLTP